MSLGRDFSLGPWVGAWDALSRALGVRVMRVRPHLGHAGQADELLESACDDLWAVFADDPRLRSAIPKKNKDGSG